VDLRQDQFNRDINLRLSVWANQANRRWRLRLRETSVRHGLVHARVLTGGESFAGGIFMNESSPQYSIGMPAPEERAISVASFVTRASALPGCNSLSGLTNGKISPFSSHGPGPLETRRPDIAALGQHIVGALANGSVMATGSLYTSRHLPAAPTFPFREQAWPRRLRRAQLL